MKVGVLTSSRADYGIYLPLLNAMQADPYFDLRILAFGTHLSRFHGYTIDNISADGFIIDLALETILTGDSEEALATTIALTQMKFASFWATSKNTYDIVFCLGDRYEMFAAVYAATPFSIRFAHIHGGETTLGAIDNIYRHAITLASKLHFTTAEIHSDRVAAILGTSENIFNVGSLSLDNVDRLQLLSLEEFLQKWDIDLRKPAVLVTFHPETVNPEMNKAYTHALCDALLSISGYAIIVTMPNADTDGALVRSILKARLSGFRSLSLIENFGPASYFTCMKYCAFMIGNTSSGIIEAASFGKYVINIGDRQKGRVHSGNIIHTPIDKGAILQAVERLRENDEYSGTNIFKKDDVAGTIINTLKNDQFYQNPSCIS